MSDRQSPAPRSGGYHYSREERLARAGSGPGRPGPKRRTGLPGFLRGNRIFIILLADVLLVCLGTLLVRHLAEPRIELAGFSLALSAEPEEDRVVISLTVRRLRSADPEGPDTAPGRVFVRFSYPDGTAEMFTSAELPRGGEKSRVLRGILLRPEGDAPGQVLAEVEIGAARRELSRPVDRVRPADRVRP